MNVIQQEALANAAGLTVDQLSDAFIQHKLIKEESKSQYARLKEAHQDELARRFALGEYDDKEIEAANKRLDAQEKFNLSMDKLKETFSDLVDGGALDAISNAAMALADTIQSGGSLFSIFGESDLTKNLNKKSLEQAYETEKELANKKELNSLEKERLENARARINEDQRGKKGLVKKVQQSGSTSNKVGEIAKENGKQAVSGTPQYGSLDDFIMRPGQPVQKFRKDDVVIGGTNLLGGGKENTEVVTLLRELVASVKQGGNIYLDGTKVGTAMGISAYKTQ